MSPRTLAYQWMMVALLFARSAFGADAVTLSLQSQTDETPKAQMTTSFFERDEKPNAEESFDRLVRQAAESGEPTQILCVKESPLSTVCDGLEEKVKEIVSHVENPSELDVKVVAVKAPAETPQAKKSNFKDSYGYRFKHGLIRAGIAGGAMALTMWYRDADLETVLRQGGLSADWAFGMQFFYKYYNNLIRNRKLLSTQDVKDGQQAGAAKQLAKKALSSTLNAVILKTGLGFAPADFLTGPVATSVGKTVGKSLIAQSAWHELIGRWKARGKDNHPGDEERAAYYDKNASRGAVAQSAMNTVGNGLNITDSGLGDYWSGGMGATGAILMVIDKHRPEWLAGWVPIRRRKKDKNSETEDEDQKKALACGEALAALK